MLPLLCGLGYHDTDWKSQVGIGKTKADFLVHPHDPLVHYLPYLVIEVKTPNKKIAQSIWQISAYMRQSRAVLGLLTNGYSFCLLYYYQDQVFKIAEYSQPTLIKNFNLVHKLLSKETCLKVREAVHHSQQHIYLKFASRISNAFDSKEMMKLFHHKSESTGQPTLKEHKSMIITVFNNKGGVGKTTMTINLAAALNKLGKRVLLIDIDPQANLTTGLGVDPLEDVEKQGRKDISNLLTEPRMTLEEAIIKKRWDDIQLDIIPSHIRLSDMEATLFMTPDIDRVLKKKLKNYVDQYDYIFIDPPPSFGKVNTIALMASSGVLIPTQLSPYPIRALEYVVDRAIAIDQSREEPLLILGIAVSMYNRAANKVARNMLDELMKVLSKTPESNDVNPWPDHTWIPNLSIISTTPNKGYPICHAEFDDDLEQREKESAQEAFSYYISSAEYLIQTTNKNG